MDIFNIEQALNQDLIKVDGTLFVAVDGHGGSGKTTFASKLSEVLGAEVVHVDDFASYIQSTDLAESIIKTVFEPISRGSSSLTYTPYQFWDNHRPEPVIDQPVTPIMILEGVGSYREQLRPYVGFSIFVDTPVDVCLKRGVARDLQTVDKSEKELKTIWRKWIEKEMVHFEENRNKENSDLVVDGRRPFEEQIVLG